jgi:hypothetical protein
LVLKEDPLEQGLLLYLLGGERDMRTKTLLGALVLGVGLLLGGASSSQAGWYPYCGGPRIVAGYYPTAGYYSYYRPYYFRRYRPVVYRPYAYAPYYSRAHYYRPHVGFRAVFGW